MARIVMKNFILVVLFTIVTTAQSKWENVFPNITINQITAVAALDNSNWFLASSGGEVFKTSDAGKNWKLIYNNPDKSIKRIYFFDKEHGWFLVGNKLTRTTDGGNIWIESEVPISPGYVSRFYFINPMHGMLFGKQPTRGRVIKK
jgi:photosystem II stability/assembly factor-like uncharacterized protein